MDKRPLCDYVNSVARGLARNGVFMRQVYAVPKYILDRVSRDPLFNFGFDHFLIDREKDNLLVGQVWCAVKPTDKDWWDVENGMRLWRSAVELDVSKFSGMTILQHEETTKEAMSEALRRLIDLVVEDCKDLDLEAQPTAV